MFCAFALRYVVGFAVLEQMAMQATQTVLIVLDEALCSSGRTNAVGMADTRVSVIPF